MKAAMPSPRNAPSVSEARCRPKASPRCLSSTESAINASRGAVRTPLPIRSATRTPSTQPHALAKYKSGLASAESAYPITANGLRFPKRSDVAPKKILSKLAVVSATPSINPITAVRTPRIFARKNGIRFNNISEEMSLRSDVADITHTLRGKPRQPFWLCTGGVIPPLLPFVGDRAGLLDPQDLAVDVDDDLESHHAKVCPHILWQTYLQKLVELLVYVFQLLLDGSLGEHILLPQHFGGLLGKEVFTAFHHLRQLVEHLPVHLLRGDVTAEARVIHHVAGLIAHQGRFGGVSKFIEDKTSE